MPGGSAKAKSRDRALIPGHQPYLRGDNRWKRAVLSWPEDGHQRQIYRKRVGIFGKFSKDEEQVGYWAYAAVWTLAHTLPGTSVPIVPGSQIGSEMMDGCDVPVVERQRIGAIHYLDPASRRVYVFGCGEIIGPNIPPENVRGSCGSLHSYSVRSHEISLDAGYTVWSCECWWAPEGEYKQLLRQLIKDGFEAHKADIERYRRDGARKFDIQGE